MAASITVVIPVYNLVGYLSSTVESVLAQSPLPDQILIVDDGSTDGSADLAEKQFGSHPLVTIVRKPNGGAGDARNWGLAQATGEFVYFLDGDDLVLPGLFQAFQAELARTPDLDLWAFSTDLFSDSDEVDVGRVARRPFEFAEAQSFADGPSAFVSLYEQGRYSCPVWRYLIRRQVLLDHELAFDRPQHEDEGFTVQAYLFSGRVVTTPAVFHRYRLRVGSITTTTKRPDHLAGWVHFLQVADKLRSQERWSPAVRGLLRAYRMRYWVYCMRMVLHDKSGAMPGLWATWNQTDPRWRSKAAVLGDLVRLGFRNLGRRTLPKP